MIVGAGFVLVRLGVYLDLMALFGLASFGLYALRRPERRFGAKAKSSRGELNGRTMD